MPAPVVNENAALAPPALVNLPLEGYAAPLAPALLQEAPIDHVASFVTTLLQEVT